MLYIIINNSNFIVLIMIFEYQDYLILQLLIIQLFNTYLLS